MKTRRDSIRNYAANYQSSPPDSTFCDSVGRRQGAAGGGDKRERERERERKTGIWGVFRDDFPIGVLLFRDWFRGSWKDAREP